VFINTVRQQDQDDAATFRLPGATETNQSASFSHSEDQLLEVARELEKRSFERWLVLGRGVKILRQRADLLNLGVRQ
jgi:hypothetical protein